jgi:cell division protein ZapA
MTIVKLSIGGRLYQLSCEDGQETHLYRLGEYLDDKAKQLKSSCAHINEPLLLAMVGIMVADELFAVKNAASQAHKEEERTLTDEVVKELNDITSTIYRLAESAKL